jgi:glycyl-tRNA synthetase beta chain
LAPLPVSIDHADHYVELLRKARVLVDPAERRSALGDALLSAAKTVGGTPSVDGELLEELVELVEWPGAVVGQFDREFLALPREILVTTLKHHQKSFSIQDADALLPAFLSVANTDRDPGGHVRRGNEWVVVGRLEDARFFWTEDRKRSLSQRGEDLARVTFHKKLGSYADKAGRIADLAAALATKLGLAGDDTLKAVEAARVAKNDLTTGLVGEFPELQGVIGGLLLRAEGADAAMAQAVAEHYRPVGADDAIPASELSCIVSVADRLDTVSGLIGTGELPTGSRDPFGLRRATGGVFRILSERAWSLSMSGLSELTGQNEKVRGFLQERLSHWLVDRGYTPNEIEAVRRKKVSATEFDTWSMQEILKRLEAVATVRGRDDFSKLVELVKRVDNILVKQGESGTGGAFEESHASALALMKEHEARLPRILAASSANDFPAVIEEIAGLVTPVAKFFDDVLVLDPDNPGATRARCELLAKVRTAVTRDFDIRELAGQAEAKR